MWNKWYIKDFLIKTKLFSSWQLSIITYISKSNLKYVVFLSLFLWKPIQELNGMLLCLFLFAYFSFDWLFAHINSYLMLGAKALFANQCLRDKTIPLNSLSENNIRKLSMNSTALFALYYTLSTLWDVLYCCLKLPRRWNSPLNFLE